MARNKSQTLGRGGGCLLFVFFSFIFGMLCLVGYSLVIEPMLLRRESMTWSPVPCVIQESSVDTHAIKHKDNKNRRNRNQDSTGYSPKVRYEYIVNEKVYTGGQFWFDQTLLNSKEEAQALIQPFPVGAESVCYVDPNNAERAVLVREGQTTSNIVIGAFIGFFALFTGIGSLVSLWFLVRPKPAKPQSPVNRTSRSVSSTSPTNSLGSTAKYHDNSDVCPIESEEPDEPLVLKQSSSRVGTAIGIWIFALIWNGFIGGFIWLVLQKGSPWFPLIILGVFALIGLAIIWSAIYKTLQIWNPVTTVICSQRNIYPGSEFEISWLHQGKTSSIKNFSIYLESEESVTYRQGTSTRTETRKLHEQIVVSSAEQSDIAQGFKLVEVPLDAMHTFKANRNKIKWQIRVRGTIAFWPDIDDTYEVTVYPPRIAEPLHA